MSKNVVRRLAAALPPPSVVSLSADQEVATARSVDHTNPRTREMKNFQRTSAASRGREIRYERRVCLSTKITIRNVISWFCETDVEERSIAQSFSLEIPLRVGFADRVPLSPLDEHQLPFHRGKPWCRTTGAGAV